MPLAFPIERIWRFLDTRPEEVARVVFMATFLFCLLAANNVIKVVRDSLFLSRFPITQLPVVYIMTALAAALAISVYSRYSFRFSHRQIILRSHAFIISTVIFFWALVAFYDFGWMLYAFYIWSGIVGLVVVAQFWTLANELFSPREGKRLFGVLTAAGTLGGMAGGFSANWAVSFLFGTRHLLWIVALLFAAAFAVVWLAAKERGGILGAGEQELAKPALRELDAKGVVGLFAGSRYLQAIATLIFVSVIVSTLIDYQFKAAAKSTYLSADALAGFFGAYYAWLSGLTLVAQLWLTRRLLMGLGLGPSLLLLPLTLLVGSISLLVWPGLLAAATGTRLAEASLRTSVHRSGVEILYLPIPDVIKKRIKVFLDVTVERLGDGTAAFIILFYTFVLAKSDVSSLSYFSLGIIFIWIGAIFLLRSGYMDALRRSLAYREISLEGARIDYEEKGIIEVVLNALEQPDEESVLFGLEIAEKLDPKSVVPRLPRALLSHPRPAVRVRAIKLLALHPNPTILGSISGLLQDSNPEIRAEAIRATCAVFKGDALKIVRPFLESPDPQVKRRALECSLRHGEPDMRNAALNELDKMVCDESVAAESGRIEVARLAGEVYDPALAADLRKLITNDPSWLVKREAMLAAGKARYPEVILDIIPRLGNSDTKAAARKALVEYGELAVEHLAAALFDATVPREVRLNVPRTLSKIGCQSAMNALMAGLVEEDRVVRFKIILALEEIARRFPELKVDRQTVETAIVSDVLLYSQRFVIFFVLFRHDSESGHGGQSLLAQALMDSMGRVKERLMWLLSLIYPQKDIRRAWVGLSLQNPRARAHAIELLDILLPRKMKRYVFPVFSDFPDAQRFKASLDLIGLKGIDTESAFRTLLKQGDVWLTAATVWEIGIRRVTGFRDEILALSNSDKPVLRETATVVIRGL